MNDLLLPLDEIAEISAQDLGESIYMLANGTAKARMTKGALLGEPSRWRVTIISSGEISVEEKLRSGGQAVKAGQEVRLIDIEADSRLHGAFDDLHSAPSAAAFADTLKRNTRASHGTSGRAFVNRLITSKLLNNPDDLEPVLQKWVAGWCEELQGAADGQVKRIARRLAVIALAGEQATQFGLTGWMRGDALAAAKQAFLDWHGRRYGALEEIAADYVSRLQTFLAANLNTLPKIGATTSGDAAPDGWTDPTHVYLTQLTWSKIFTGCDASEAAKALIAMHMLQPGDDGRPMRKAPRAVPNRPRLYTLNLANVTAFKTS